MSSKDIFLDFVSGLPTTTFNVFPKVLRGKFSPCLIFSLFILFLRSPEKVQESLNIFFSGKTFVFRKFEELFQI